MQPQGRGYVVHEGCDHLFFVGFLGAGKSTLARNLGSLFHRPHVDTDRLVERALGQSVTEIFSTLGEPAFREAETLYLQAIACIAEDERAQIGLWQARTHNYTSPDVLYDGDMAAEFARALPAARGGVLQAFGEALAKERGALSAEADPLRRKVEAAQEARRGPFAANRAYYRVRAVVALALVVLFAVGAAVSAAYILRTRSVAPIVLTASFGALALAVLTALCVFAHKWYVAAGLCRENERLASTPEGERLAALEERLACLGLALGEETFRPTEHGAEEAPAPQADAPRQ